MRKEEIVKESKLAEEGPDGGCGSRAEVLNLSVPKGPQVPRVQGTAGVGGAKGLPTFSLEQSAQGMKVGMGSKMGQIFLVQLQRHSQ